MIPIKLPKEDKEVLVRSVQAYFEEEHGETIGEIRAEALIDYMIGELAPHLYNHGLADARRVLAEKAAQTEDELYALVKPLRTIRR